VRLIKRRLSDVGYLKKNNIFSFFFPPYRNVVLILFDVMQMDKRDVLETKTLQLGRNVKDHQLPTFHFRDNETQLRRLNNLPKVQY